MKTKWRLIIALRGGREKYGGTFGGPRVFQRTGPLPVLAKRLSSPQATCFLL
jgi:hypothetical protein